ncbi:MAG TPA: 2-C-methyl-D-erythritol 4-phosphate cytidylyltransferase [Acidimicrobiales bacterium]|nr:2-C-methyl-D-erythritol 4-phosphate cytidylyltransferase [Acidimicrobiales bacterium]
MGVEVWAIVVAAGEGRRFGQPKQFAVLGGRSVIEWSLEASRSVARGVVAVVPESSLASSVIVKGADRVIVGGPTRASSVRRGLAAVPEHADVVVVHDAARPLASPELFRAVVEAVVAGADAAIPGLAVVDTVKRVRNGCVVETLDRRELVAIQTPQAFRAAVLRRAHVGEPEATDDAALVEALGSSIVVVPGEYHNLKLTSPDDLATAERWSSR